MSQDKSLDTLIPDIYDAVKSGVEITEAQAHKFGHALSNLISERLRPRAEPRAFTLRMSNIGKGARQLWYEKRFASGEEFQGPTLIKFIYGEILEQLVLFLADAAGHKVTEHQGEVSLNGIRGHIDADINAVTVDVKSASPYSFKKFKDGSLVDNDSFGYMEQLASYSEARGTDGAFIAIDKVSGELAKLSFTKEELSQIKVADRIDFLKVVVESDDIPERCYSDEEYGKSGNRALSVNCSYCGYKDRCWADSNGGIGLRKFIYSSKPVFMTEVRVEPKVFEVFPTQQ